MSHLVLDAPLAVRQREYAGYAEEAGVPLLVDPLTHFVASELEADAPWVRATSFGKAIASRAADFVDPRESAAFVEQVVKFQVEHGATMVIPPYAYASSPEDPWFSLSLEWIGLTVRVMRAHDLRLPVAPILCGSLQGFGPPPAWDAGIDRFVAAALGVGPAFLGVCLGPLGDGRESYRKLRASFTVVNRMRSSGARVIAWRQGVYGLALSAAGADGYECGIGVNERTAMRDAMNRQKPRRKKSEGGGSGGRLYLEPLGTSVPKKAALALLGNDMTMRAKVMCDDPACCPHGVQSTLEHHWEHTVRSRSRELATLDALPGNEWRLNQMHMKAKGWLSLRMSANRLLEENGHSHLPTSGLDSLIRVLDEVRRESRQPA